MICRIRRLRDICSGIDLSCSEFWRPRPQRMLRKRVLSRDVHTDVVMVFSHAQLDNSSTLITGSA